MKEPQSYVSRPRRIDACIRQMTLDPALEARHSPQYLARRPPHPAREHVRIRRDVRRAVREVLSGPGVPGVVGMRFVWPVSVSIPVDIHVGSLR